MTFRVIDVMKYKQWFEPIGLFLLLFSFGWQCLEERSNQMKNDSVVYEMNENIYAIWECVYDEALCSDRYHGKALFSVDYDSMNKFVKDWEQIQKGNSRINSQASCFFGIRAVFYILGSIIVLLSKIPDEAFEY